MPLCITIVENQSLRNGVELGERVVIVTCTYFVGAVYITGSWEQQDRTPRRHSCYIAGVLLRRKSRKT